MPVLKGAFIKFDAALLGFAPNIVIFQFNPETVSRNPSLAQLPSTEPGGGSKSTHEQPGEPAESISFSLRLDATDQLARGDPIAAASGILPALSALELLLYPKPPVSIDLFAGTVTRYQNPPLKLSTVLFFWGPYRILPVNVTALSIQETEYDQLLTPIRAEVSVSLDVLTPSKVDQASVIERGAYTYTQGVKEVMAAANLAGPAELITKTLAQL